jgi:hypothetical protein
LLGASALPMLAGEWFSACALGVGFGPFHFWEPIRGLVRPAKFAVSRAVFLLLRPGSDVSILLDGDCCDGDCGVLLCLFVACL